MLARRNLLVDFFFSLEPLEPADRLQQIFSCARRFLVEVETHPVNVSEYQLLQSGEIYRRCGDVQIASHFATRQQIAGASESDGS